MTVENANGPTSRQWDELHELSMLWLSQARAFSETTDADRAMPAIRTLFNCHEQLRSIVRGADIAVGMFPSEASQRMYFKRREDELTECIRQVQYLMSKAVKSGTDHVPLTDLDRIFRKAEVPE